MLLRYFFDLDEEAKGKVETAVEEVLKAGYRTIDIMSEGMTQVGYSFYGRSDCSENSWLTNLEGVKNMRSDNVKKECSRHPHRSLFNALDYEGRDGQANDWYCQPYIEIVPCHMNSTRL